MLQLASKVLHFPAFAFSLSILYWSLPLAALTGRLQVCKLRGKRNDMTGWSSFMMEYFGMKFMKVGSNGLHRGDTCIYLANHRCWADFFVDTHVTEGRAMLLSRWAVFWVFPMFCLGAWVIRGVVLFKRCTILDKEKFNAWLDNELATSPVPGLLVFPEGHRSLQPSGLPLKRGMLNYAFRRKLPVQVVITRGKEGVLNEKTLRAGFGVTLAVGYSELVETRSFATFDEFVARLQVVWDAKWEEVYGADLAGEPQTPGSRARCHTASVAMLETHPAAALPAVSCELKALDLQSAPLLHEYSSGIKLKQALLGVLSVSLLAATVAGSVWAATAFVSLFTGVVKKVGSPACVRRSSARSGPESSANRTHATRCVRTRRAQSVTSSAHPASLSLSLLRAVLVPVRCCAEL
ncbi:MAG: hypothetical protein WDW36_001253 [Sanguina aurantia]